MMGAFSASALRSPRSGRSGDGRTSVRAAIRAGSVTIWLQADRDLILSRVRRRSNRPLLKTPNPRQTLQDLIDRRYPTYAEADVTVLSRDVPQEQVASEVIDAVIAHLGDKNG